MYDYISFKSPEIKYIIFLESHEIFWNNSFNRIPKYPKNLVNNVSKEIVGGLW